MQELTASDARVAASGMRRLVVLALTALVLLAALYLLAVQTGWGQRLDGAALEGRTTRAPVLRATGRLLDTISLGSLAFLGGGILGVAIARRRVHLAFTAGIVVLGANLTTQILKEVLPRPILVSSELPGQSYPSGHTTVAMSLAVALVLVVPARARATAAFLGLGYALLVGTATVTAGWHRPSDVMAGYLVVTAWGAAATAGLVSGRGATEEDESDAPLLPIVSPVFVIGGGALVGLAFLGFVAVFLALRLDRLDAVRLSGAYAASLAAMAGVGMVAMAGVLWSIHGVGLDPPRRRRLTVRGGVVRR